MSTLAVVRADDWGGRFRRLKVYVDGSEVAGLRPGETFTAELPAGRHDVRGSMDWATCAPLSVDVPGEAQVRVEVSLPFWSVFKAFVTPRGAVQVRLL